MLQNVKRMEKITSILVENSDTFVECKRSGRIGWLGRKSIRRKKFAGILCSVT